MKSMREQHDCTTCPYRLYNPLDAEKARRKLQAIVATLDGWNAGSYTVSVHSDKFDILAHEYDLRSVVASVYVTAMEGLGKPIDKAPNWSEQYPVILPGNPINMKGDVTNERTQPISIC